MGTVPMNDNVWERFRRQGAFDAERVSTAEARELQDEIIELQTEVQHLQAQNAELAEELEANRAFVEAVKQEAARADALYFQRMKEFEDRGVAAGRRLMKLEEQLQQAETDLSIAQSELLEATQQCEQQVEHISSLESEGQRLREELAALKQQHKETQEALANAVLQQKDAEEQLAELQEKSARDEEYFQAERVILQRREDATSRMNKLAEQQAMANAERAAELEALQLSINDQQTALQEREAAAQLREEAAAKAEQRLQEASAEQTRREAAIAVKEAELKAREDDIASRDAAVQSTKATTSQAVKKRETAVQQREKALKERQQQLEQQQISMDQSAQQIEVALKSLEADKKMFQQQESELAQQKADIQAREEQLRKAEAAEDHLVGEELANVRKQQAEVRKERAELEKKAQQLQQSEEQLQAAAEAQSAAEGRLAAMQQRLDALQAELKDRQQRVGAGVAAAAAGAAPSGVEGGEGSPSKRPFYAGLISGIVNMVNGSAIAADAEKEHGMTPGHSPTEAAPKPKTGVAAKRGRKPAAASKLKPAEAEPAPEEEARAGPPEGAPEGPSAGPAEEAAVAVNDSKAAGQKKRKTRGAAAETEPEAADAAAPPKRASWRKTAREASTSVDTEAVGAVAADADETAAVESAIPARRGRASAAKGAQEPEKKGTATKARSAGRRGRAAAGGAVEGAAGLPTINEDESMQQQSLLKVPPMELDAEPAVKPATRASSGRRRSAPVTSGSQRTMSTRARGRRVTIDAGEVQQVVAEPAATSQDDEGAGLPSKRVRRSQTLNRLGVSPSEVEEILSEDEQERQQHKPHWRRTKTGTLRVSSETLQEAALQEAAHVVLPSSDGEKPEEAAKPRRSKRGSRKK